MKTGQKSKKGGTECGFCSAETGIGQRHVLSRKKNYYLQPGLEIAAVLNTLQNGIGGRSMKTRTNSHYAVSSLLRQYYCQH